MLETRGNAEICTADDAVRLQDSPQNRTIINSLFELGGDPDVEKFREVVGMSFLLLNFFFFWIDTCNVLSLAAR